MLSINLVNLAILARPGGRNRISGCTLLYAVYLYKLVAFRLLVAVRKVAIVLLPPV